MATWYVRPDASHGGTNSGTSYENSWQGWSAIVAGSLTAGDTIYVCGTFSANGAHLQTQKSGSSGFPITYRGDYTRDPGIFTQTTAHSVVIAHDYVIFDSITFNQTAAQMIVAVQGAGTDYGTIRNCTFNGTVDADFGLIRFVATVSTQAYTGWLIENNSFIGSARAGIEWFPTVAAALFSLNALTIRSNTWTSFKSNNNGGCISFRTGGVDADKGIMTDIIIDDNVFTDCEGVCIRFGDQGATSTPSRIGIWTGVKVRNNTITRQKYCTFPVSGRPANGWQTGGGIAITGFGVSTTQSFGPNEVSYNTMTNLQGITGGINTFTGTYWVHHNRITGVETRNGVVDGNGILIDYGSQNCLVEKNYVADALGDLSNTQSNSGMAYGTIGAANIIFRSNVSRNTRHGMLITDGGYVTSQPVEVTGNTFMECVFTGVWQNSNYASVCTLQNNIITGTGVSFGIQGTGHGTSSGGYSLILWNAAGGYDWGVERNNAVYNCPYGPWDWKGANGAGATYIMDATTVTANPIISNGGSVKSESPVIEAGTHTAYSRDFTNIQRRNPPAIGAYEYIRARGTRT